MVKMLPPPNCSAVLCVASKTKKDSLRKMREIKHLPSALVMRLPFRTGSQRESDAELCGIYQKHPIGYIPSLDGIRAISILIVFASHSGYGDYVPGSFGVTVFFFLSGFLITTLLEKEAERSGRVSLRLFYSRRFLRLYPPLVAAMLLSLGFVWINLIDGDFRCREIFSQLLFYYNYYRSYSDGEAISALGPLWSLSVEEHFYVIWPVVFTILRGIPGRIWILFGALFGVAVWRCVCFEIVQRHLEDVYFLYLTDTRLDSILYGCVLAISLQGGQSSKIFPESYTASRLLMAACLFLLLVTFTVRDEFFRNCLRFSLQGIALGPLFYYSMSPSGDPIFNILNFRIIRKIGELSYSIYLVHLTFIQAIFRFDWFDGERWIVFAISFLASFAWAAAVYQFIERPILPLRVRLTRR